MMLSRRIGRLRPRGLRHYLSAGQFFCFLDGYAYIFIYAALAFVSSLCGQEPLVFGLTALLVVLVCLFAKDTRALVPPIILVIYAVSWMHTPQSGADFFNAPATFVSFGILGAVATVFGLSAMYVLTAALIFLLGLMALYVLTRIQ